MNAEFSKPIQHIMGPEGFMDSPEISPLSAEEERGAAVAFQELCTDLFLHKMSNAQLLDRRGDHTMNQLVIEWEFESPTGFNRHIGLWSKRVPRDDAASLYQLYIATDDGDTNKHLAQQSYKLDSNREFVTRDYYEIDQEILEDEDLEEMTVSKREIGALAAFLWSHE